MHVRPATPDDAEAIHRVSAASCRAAYEPILADETLLEIVEDPSRVDGVREWLAETADDDAVVYLVAVDGESVVGFAQFLWGERRPDHVDEGAFLRSLYVAPERWHEGFGSELLTDGISRLPAGTNRLQLGVLSENDLGKRFYEARGFRCVDDGTFEVEGATYETDVYAAEIRDE